jgi:hypothetical protein
MARQRGLFIFWSQTTMRLFQRVKSYFWRFYLSSSRKPSPAYVYENCSDNIALKQLKTFYQYNHLEYYLDSIG